MTDQFRTVVATSGNVQSLVYEGSPALVVNLDSNNVVWIGSDHDVGPNNLNNSSPLPPNSAAYFDAELPVYGICSPGQSAQVGIFPGALNYFQLLSIIIKTLIISASAGNGIFVYSGVPALGNLIVSIATAATTFDFKGNAILPGVVVYNGAGQYIQIYQNAIIISGGGNSPAQITATPQQLFFSAGKNLASDVISSFNLNSVPAGSQPTAQMAAALGFLNLLADPGIIANYPSLYGFAGYLRTKTPAGEVLDNGRFTAYTTARMTVNQTTNMPIPGLATPWNVVANKRYRLSGMIALTQGGGAFANNIGFAGPAITDCGIGFRVFEGTTIFGTGFLTALGQFSTGVIPVLTTAEAYFDGVVAFSASGIFSMFANEGTATHIWNIEIDSFFDLKPVTN